MTQPPPPTPTSPSEPTLTPTQRKRIEWVIHCLKTADRKLREEKEDDCYLARLLQEALDEPNKPW